jgi:phosphoenolpyruvate-protein kinase (PTS system EI component)
MVSLSKINCADIHQSDMGLKEDRVIDAFLDAMRGDKEDGDIRKRIIPLFQRLEMKAELENVRVLTALVEAFPNDTEYMKLFDDDTAKIVPVVIQVLLTGKSTSKVAAGKKVLLVSSDCTSSKGSYESERVKRRREGSTCARRTRLGYSSVKGCCSSS